MSHYCRRFDAREVFHPARALRRVWQGGNAYWHAWGITLAALAVSFVGLLGLGLGFLVTSVWFWQVAGYSFGTVFSQRFDLFDTTPEIRRRSEEHTSELQSLAYLVCRLLLEKKKY